MKRTCLLAVAVIGTFVLVHTTEAYPRGGGGARSFGGGGHFSAPRTSGGHYSGGGFRSAGPSRSYSSARYYGPRTAAMPSHRSYGANRPRYSPTTGGVRNPAYTGNRGRFDGNRTTAFNTRTDNRSGDRAWGGNRTNVSRSGGFNQGRVIGRYNASHWNRHWSHNRDHWWRGHRCHYRNGFWFIYDPFPFYPYYYGYYPYGGYYDGGYYDDGSYSDQTAPATYNDQQVYNDDSRVTDVQRALAREGYYDGAIDGTMGPATRNALRRYQRDHGLKANGQIDHAVIQALRLR